jgi:hypothetical protein
VCERRKLLVNIAKSKAKRITRRENVGDIYITLNEIRKEEFNCFRYLEVDIDRDGSMKSEMEHCLTEEEKVSAVLRKI